VLIVGRRRRARYRPGRGVRSGRRRAARWGSAGRHLGHRWRVESWLGRGSEWVSRV